MKTYQLAVITDSLGIRTETFIYKHMTELLPGKTVVVARRKAIHFDDITEWKARKLAEGWERRGWLDAGRDAASPRMVNEVLIELAGLSPQNEQKMLTRSHASQGITGP